jgi:hypothetical protein
MKTEITSDVKFFTVNSYNIQIEILGEDKYIDEFINSAEYNHYAHKGLLNRDLSNKYGNELKEWEGYRSIYFDLLTENVKSHRKNISLLNHKFNGEYYLHTPEELLILRHGIISSIVDNDHILKSHINSKFNNIFSDSYFSNDYYFAWKQEHIGCETAIEQGLHVIAERFSPKYSSLDTFKRDIGVLTIVCRLTDLKFPVLFWRVLADRFYNLTFKITTGMYYFEAGRGPKQNWYERICFFHNKEAFYIETR